MLFHDIFDKSAQTPISDEPTSDEPTHAAATEPMSISAGEKRTHSTSQAESSRAALDRTEPEPPQDDTDKEHEHTTESDQDDASSVYSDSGSETFRRKRLRGMSLRSNQMLGLKVRY